MFITAVLIWTFQLSQKQFVRHPCCYYPIKHNLEKLNIFEHLSNYKI